MYSQYFGLKEKPFNLVPDPAYLYLSQSHAEASDHLEYAIAQGEGFVLITGEVGTGKTTLCRAFLETRGDDVEAAYIFNPKLDTLGLLKAINDEFGLAPAASGRETHIDNLTAFLLSKRACGRACILLIDEAHNLEKEILEQICRLSNLETEQRKLLQIVLVGQPELRLLLATPEMQQLARRIALNCHLTPLCARDTAGYIEHRLTVASLHGGPPFSRGAHRRIYRYSKGIPRLINVVCDRALLTAFSKETPKITTAVVRQAVGELQDQDRTGRPNAGTRNAWSWAAVIVSLVLLAATILPWKTLSGLQYHGAPANSLTPASAPEVESISSPAVAIKARHSMETVRPMAVIPPHLIAKRGGVVD